MKNIFFAALNLMLALAIVSPLHAQQQQLWEAQCATTHQGEQVTQVMRLTHGAQTTLDIRDGQRVMLSSDSGGQAFVSQGIVTFHTLPGNMALAVNAVQADAQEVTSFFATGENHVSLTTTVTDEVFWLLVFSPCPAAEASPVAVAAVPEATNTATAVPTPTPSRTPDTAEPDAGLVSVATVTPTPQATEAAVTESQMATTSATLPRQVWGLLLLVGSGLTLVLLGVVFREPITRFVESHR